MRQLATGAEGHGYEINYAMRDEPPDVVALKTAAIKAEDGSEEKQRRIEAYRSAAMDWQQSDDSKGAFLICDAKLVGVFATGEMARAAAVKHEPALAANIGAAPLRWRTE